MTNQDFLNKLHAIIDSGIASNNEVCGLRFEGRDYSVGSVVANSRHNADREDERDYPNYDSDDYAAMQVLPGCCTWQLTIEGRKIMPKIWTKFFMGPLDKLDGEFDAEGHCYIVGGEMSRFEEYAADDDEMLIEDGTVIAKLF